MYSLDVNFLKDRDPQPVTSTSSTAPSERAAMTPLFIGVAIGLLLPGLVGGFWFFLQQQIAQKEQQQAELVSELGRLQIEQDKIKKLNDQIAEVNSETEALASVFNQIKPWSAMLQDVRERVPPGVQIQDIKQTQVAPKTASTNAAPPPKGNAAAKAKAAPNATQPAGPTPAMNLAISGTARSFDEVNYFLLTLQRSSFFNSDDTQLVKAELVKNPNKLEVPKNIGQSNVKVTYELPELVQYTIQTTLSDVPASELLRELDRKGAVGLVTRIRTLQGIQDKGVTQP